MDDSQQLEGEYSPPPQRLPRLLTPQRADTLCRALEEGKSEQKALEAARVGREDVDWWLDAAEGQGSGKFADFALRYRSAVMDLVRAHGLPTRRIAIPLAYDPHYHQRQLHALQLIPASYTRFVAACCGRRGGKTYGGAAHFGARIMADIEQKLAGEGRWAGRPHWTWVRGTGRDPKPFLHYWVVAPTYALLDEPKKALQRVLGTVGQGGVIVHQTDRRWWLLGGIQIEFRSGDNPARLVGAGLDGMWMDEAARVKPAVWRDNLRPALSDQSGWGLFTTTPLGKNWFWEDVWAHGDDDAAEELAQMRERMAEDIRDPEFGCISWYTSDNTQVPGLAEEMEIARRQMPEALFDRNYRASFEAFEGQCFDLSRARHFRPRKVQVHPAALVRVAAGLDIGLNDHPSVFVLVGQDRAGVWHELRTEQLFKGLPYHEPAFVRREEHHDPKYMANIAWKAITDALGDDPRFHWRTVPIYCPADNADWSRALRMAGFRVRQAFQSHEPAVTWASTALHNDFLTISSPVQWRCLVNLRYPGDGETSKKLWMEKGDDPWDALRYALSDPISKVRHDLPTRTRLPSFMGARV